MCAHAASPPTPRPASDTPWASGAVPCIPSPLSASRRRRGQEASEAGRVAVEGGRGRSRRTRDPCAQAECDMHSVSYFLVAAFHLDMNCSGSANSLYSPARGWGGG